MRMHSLPVWVGVFVPTMLKHCSGTVELVGLTIFHEITWGAGEGDGTGDTIGRCAVQLQFTSK